MVGKLASRALKASSTRSASSAPNLFLAANFRCAQCAASYAARALLGWSQSDLARYSGISEPTIARLESAEGQLGGRGETVKKIRVALERSGIEFIDENGGGPGVRLRTQQQRKKT
ncbi:MAG: helix-turn-helix domain-containing protein [Xanthobacteraceae bacterium]